MSRHGFKRATKCCLSSLLQHIQLCFACTNSRRLVSQQSLPQSTFVLFQLHQSCQGVFAALEPLSLQKAVLQHLFVLGMQARVLRVSVRSSLVKVAHCCLYGFSVPATRLLVSCRSTPLTIQTASATYAGGTEGMSWTTDGGCCTGLASCKRPSSNTPACAAVNQPAGTADSRPSDNRVYAIKNSLFFSCFWILPVSGCGVK